MRERLQSIMKSEGGHDRERSDSEAGLVSLVALAKRNGELYDLVMKILSGFSLILERETDRYDCLLCHQPANTDWHHTAKPNQTSSSYSIISWSRQPQLIICKCSIIFR